MDIKTAEMRYKTKDDEILAHLAQPSESGKYPGIVLIHEIFGLDDFHKQAADRLAAEGYVVLAPHLFSSNKLSPILSPQNIGEAMKFMMSIPPDKQRDESYRAAELEKLGPEQKKAVMEVNKVLFIDKNVELFTQYLSSAVDYLNSLETVNGKIGSVGFCFGGTMSLSLACTGRTDASILFYGQNPEPIEKINNIKGGFMGLYGGEDTRLNVNIDQLVKALTTYKKPFTIKVFPGAHHAFFNGSRPHYNKAAADESWRMMLKFYKDNLG